MRNGIPILVAGLMALAAPSQAMAKNVVADPQIISKVMQDAGYRAEIAKLGNGEPYIQSASGGYPFRLFFYGCDDDFENCLTVQLFAGFRTDESPTLEEMNAYSRDNRWARVYIDAEDDPVIEMDIDLEDGGMSPELFTDNLEYWEYVMGQFAEFAISQDQ